MLLISDFIESIKPGLNPIITTPIFFYIKNDNIILIKIINLN